MRSADELSGRGRERRMLLLLRRAEIEELHERLSTFDIAEEDVLRLEIPMNDADPVRLRERLRELRDEGRHLVRRHATARSEVRAEIVALEELHHDEGDAVGRDAGVEDLHDVRALHGRRDGGLARETRGSHGIARELLRHQLHDDVRLEPQMLGEPHRSHAALRDGPEEAHRAGDVLAPLKLFHVHQNKAESSARPPSIERRGQAQRQKCDSDSMTVAFGSQRS